MARTEKPVVVAEMDEEAAIQQMLVDEVKKDEQRKKNPPVQKIRRAGAIGTVPFIPFKDLKNFDLFGKPIKKPKK